MFLWFYSVGLMHAVVKAARFGRRTEIRHISYLDPRCCDPLISINGLLPAKGNKGFGNEKGWSYGCAHA